MEHPSASDHRSQPRESADAVLRPAVARGRGTASNPPNRFERFHYEVDPEGSPDSEIGQAPSARTQYLKDPSRSILARNESPDIPFEISVNPYRGCEHGCAYCYARPYHEYLGFSAGLDFETRILVKERAPELLRKALGSRAWRPQTIAISGATDAYQPIERRARLTRACLEVATEFRNPVAVITKSRLVERDADLLAELARDRAAAVMLSITTLDPCLHRRMEPRASHPEQRLEAVERLAAAGVPVGVMVAPVIPGLNDHEIPAILDAAAKRGAVSAGFILLRLPLGVEQLFQDWLRSHAPERADKVLNRLRAMRGGALNDPRFGHRMRGGGVFAAQIQQLFELARRRNGLAPRSPELSTAAFRRPGGAQLGLFHDEAVNAL